MWVVYNMQKSWVDVGYWANNVFIAVWRCKNAAIAAELICFLNGGVPRSEMYVDRFAVGFMSYYYRNEWIEDIK